jgi:hypothetical protein
VSNRNTSGFYEAVKKAAALSISFMEYLNTQKMQKKSAAHYIKPNLMFTCFDV